MARKKCPKCSALIASAYKRCPHCCHQFYEKQKSHRLAYASHCSANASSALGSVLRVRANGEVQGYSRKLRAIKPTVFYSAGVPSDRVDLRCFTINNGKQCTEQSLAAGGRQLITADQPSPVVPMVQMDPKFPKAKLSPANKKCDWRLPKSDEDRERIQKQERLFYAKLPSRLQKSFADALRDINQKLVGHVCFCSDESKENISPQTL